MSQRLLSRSRVEAVIQKYGLYGDLKDSLGAERLIRLFRSSLVIQFAESFGRSSSKAAFTITFRGSAPDKVALVANDLASGFVDEDLKSRERVATGTAEFLSGRLEDFKKKLDRQEDELRKFKEEHADELPFQDEGSQAAALEKLRAQLKQLDRGEQASASL